MEKRGVFVFVSLILIMLMFSVVVSAAAHDRKYQFRPMNQRHHSGLDTPYMPPAQESNHVGVSDYSNTWLGLSELCEGDMQLRPANRGRNLWRFFSMICP